MTRRKLPKSYLISCTFVATMAAFAGAGTQAIAQVGANADFPFERPMLQPVLELNQGPDFNQSQEMVNLPVAGPESSNALTRNEYNPDYRSFDVSDVFDGLANEAASSISTEAVTTTPEWWDQHVTTSQRRSAQPLPTDIHGLMYLALKYSNEIRIAAEDPIIQETAITEADSNFDWVRYLDTSWNDTSEPVSNSLTTGTGDRFFNENTLQAAGGLRRNTRTGGQFDVSQRYGFQDNNSRFFIPANQATGQLTVSYAHPLLRGRGFAYNNSLVVLSQLDTGIAQDEFLSTLQDHLLEITRSYWSLYQERARLAQQTSLFLKTKDIVEKLNARQGIDAQRTQFVTASSALESRRSDLIRARTAVINAETRLRGMINAPELNVAEYAEIIPVEMPVFENAFGGLQTDLQTELQTAIQNRPEVHAAIKEIRQASVRLGVAQNEMLPLLNIVTQGYLSGLRGDSDFGGAFRDQFATGAPSYSVGLQYEMPIGNRLAKARLARRAVEMRQLQRRYALALTAIETEVDIAVREMNTSLQEIGAKRRALRAAEAETKTIEARWSKLADGSGQSGLNLESLLSAQERVTEAELDYATSLLTYNLSLINLKKANGTLLQAENVNIARTESAANGPSLQLSKGTAEHYAPGSVGGEIPCQSCAVGMGTVSQTNHVTNHVRTPTPAVAPTPAAAPTPVAAVARTDRPNPPAPPQHIARYPREELQAFRPGSIGNSVSTEAILK